MFALLWWLLALGALAVLALVGWRLWRSGVALLHEVADAGAALDRFQTALDEATARHGEAPPIRSRLGDDPAVLRAEVARLRSERAARKEARHASHQDTYERWSELFR